MSHGLIRGVFIVALAAAIVGRPHAASSSAGNPPALQRFLSLDDPTPTEYRALRHLDAQNDHFEKSAWMDVWTTADRAHGFRYEVIDAGGSDYIQSRVFLATLATEEKMWKSGEPDQAALTLENYNFEDRGTQPDGLTSLGLKPRRKGILFVEGSIFLRPDDGELVRLEGRLSKSPSFWTRRVEIIRHYARFAGVRMPVALESVASVLVAGRSTFRVTYEYETVNGQRVGTPVQRTSR
jgi:hypothetical protein